MVTSPRGRRLIPGFNSLMPSDRLRLTNHPAMTSAPPLDFFKQVLLKPRHFLDHKVAMPHVIPVKSKLHQVFDTHAP